jgi:hypothetical protein
VSGRPDNIGAAQLTLRANAPTYDSLATNPEESMPRKDVLDAIRKYTDPFRVTKGKDFRLKDFDPGDTRAQDGQAGGRGAS